MQSTTMAKRKYKEEFLDLGFMPITDSGIVKPKCVICGVVLSNESLKQNKLRRHLERKHGAFLDKERTFFKRKEVQIKRQPQESPPKKISSVQQATLASYYVAWRIAKQNKPHTIGEELIKPAAVDMVRIVCGEDVAKKIEQIPLSNSTIRARIYDISNDIKQQVIEAIKMNGQFSLRLDESTDVSDEAQIMAYVRYQGLKDMEEELLFCRPLHASTTGDDIFKIVDSFFREEGLNWNQCFSVCTDGTPSMFGARQGFATRVKEVNQQVKILHCLLHRENLASQRLSRELEIVLKEVIQVVNFIKAKSPNSSIFSQMCSDFGMEHVHLLYHSEVRWLSRGKVLQRLVESSKQVENFLSEKNHPLAPKLCDSKWIFQVAYLADIFADVNDLYISMQGHDQTLVGLSEKLTAFKEKLKSWKRKIEEGKTSCFPTMTFVLENGHAAFIDVQTTILEHLEKLISEFNLYIPENMAKYSWVCNPFNVNAEDLPEEISSITKLQEELIEIQNDEMLKHEFKNQKESLSAFWIKVHKDKPILGNEALKVIMPFATNYLCEAGFSALTIAKTKYRKRLQTEDALRCSLTSKIPRFENLSKQLQSQGSH